MRDLLQRAIEAIEKLPAEDQDAIAARLLAEAEDEEAWTAHFVSGTWIPPIPAFPSSASALGGPSIRFESVSAIGALGFRDGDHIYWFWIGSHADYDQLLSRL